MYEVGLSAVKSCTANVHLSSSSIAVLWLYHWYVLYLQDGTTPLFIACQNTHIPIVKKLIEAKANVNIPRQVSL